MKKASWVTTKIYAITGSVIIIIIVFLSDSA